MYPFEIKGDDNINRIIKNFFKLINTRTIMKTIIKGMVLLLAGASFVACSKDVSFDENAQKQAEQEAQIAQKFATYQSDFVKAFGSIASGHQWGFDQTTGRTTRASWDSSNEAWIVPDNFKNGRVTKEGVAAKAVEDAFSTSLPQTFSGFNFNNYWLQHVMMPNNVKVEIIRLEAYNSNLRKWEKVLNFDGGKNETDFEFLTDDDEIEGSPITAESTNLITAVNRSVPCATLMTDMGGSGDPQNNNKLFRVYQAVKGKKGKVTYSYNYDYYFLTNFEYYKNPAQNISGDFLGFYFTSTNNDKSSFWCIKIAEAKKDENPVLAEGRVLCEDMGANDFDFNDVVFDAWIMRSGEIKIKVLAHGGILPIAIDGQEVTLGQMTNTGVNTDDFQDITIPATSAGTPKYASIAAIPVTVNANDEAGTSYNLEAKVGTAPQKICAPINTLWPKEYTKISLAYSPFDTWVNMSDPAEWTSKMNPEKVFTFD